MSVHVAGLARGHLAGFDVPILVDPGSTSFGVVLAGDALGGLIPKGAAAADGSERYRAETYSLRCARLVFFKSRLLSTVVARERARTRLSGPDPI